MIFLLLLLYKQYIPEHHTRVLLVPYAGMVEIFYNNRHVYAEGIGFAETDGRYVIGRDCLGLGFTSMLFALCAFYPLRILTGYKKALWVVVSAIFSIFAGFIVNSVRILNSLTFLSSERFHTIHAAMGAALYLFVLCVVYFLLARAFEKTTCAKKGDM